MQEFEENWKEKVDVEALNEVNDCGKLFLMHSEANNSNKWKVCENHNIPEMQLMKEVFFWSNKRSCVTKLSQFKWLGTGHQCIHGRGDNGSFSREILFFGA